MVEFDRQMAYLLAEYDGFNCSVDQGWRICQSYEMLASFMMTLCWGSFAVEGGYINTFPGQNAGLHVIGKPSCSLILTEEHGQVLAVGVPCILLKCCACGSGLLEKVADAACAPKVRRYMLGLGMLGSLSSSNPQ